MRTIKYWAIWIWYEDFFRIFLFTIGWMPLAMLFAVFIGKAFIAAGFLIFFFLLMNFNDYSTLRRIGMNEYRDIINADVYYSRKVS